MQHTEGTGVWRAWLVVAVCSAVVGCCLGLARFAFGMLLPGISAGLGLDHAAGGLLGTSYFLGYLLTVLAIPVLVRHAGQRWLILSGLLILAIGMTGMALTADYRVLLALYTLTGIGAGGAYVPAMSLASNWFEPSHRGRAAGFMLSGAGLGIVFSGLVIPSIPAMTLPLVGNLQAWQAGWLSFAGISVVVLVAAILLVRNHPGELGMNPVGRPVNTAAAATTKGPERARPDWLNMLHLGLIYACYGITYMVYTTFIVTTMIEERGVPKAEAGLVWSLVGACSVFSGALFGGLSDRIGRRGGLVAACLVQALSFALVAGDFGAAPLMASIILFGISAWSVPTIMAAAAGDQFGPQRAAGALAIVTLIFAVGQAVGPVGAGALAEWTGRFGPGFAAAAAIAVLGAGLSLLLQGRRRRS